jgi:hypothetical protein
MIVSPDPLPPVSGKAQDSMKSLYVEAGIAGIKLYA